MSDDYLAHLSYANAADKYHTWGLGFLGYSSGLFEYIDQYGQSSLYNSVKSDWLLTYSSAYRFNPQWRFGFTLELFHSTLLEEYNAATLAIILSNSFQLGNSFRLDMALKHLGFPLSYGGENDILGMPFSAEPWEALPLTFNLGVAYDLLESLNTAEHELKLATEVSKVLLEPYRLNLGVEYKFLRMFSLRAGYQRKRQINHISPSPRRNVGRGLG